MTKEGAGPIGLYDRFLGFVQEKVDAGVISRADQKAILGVDPKFAAQREREERYGSVMLRASDVARVLPLMKQKLVELYPTLADEMRNLGSGRSR